MADEGASMHEDGVAGGGRTRSSDELWAGLVVEIAAMPDVVHNLLREHRPDEQGFCTGNGCGTAGRGVPVIRWPCPLHTLATAAKGQGAPPPAQAGRERAEPGSRPPSTEATGDRAPLSTERTEPGSRPAYGPLAWALRGR